MDLYSYTEQLVVQNADGDFRRMLKPSALLRYVEQVSSDHARACGMDDAFFKAHHMAFLAGKQAARITRMPFRGEKLTLTTACERSKLGASKRITRIYDAEGKQTALVDCRWIAVDTTREKLLREPNWEVSDYWNEELEGELPQLVHKTKDVIPAGSRTAGYSLCDLNRHINNTFYLDIACDALPLQAIEAGPLRFFCIKYHREVPMGETMELFYARSGEGWYVVGRRGPHAAFECYLEFGEEGAPARTDGQETGA